MYKVTALQQGLLTANQRVIIMNTQLQEGLSYFDYEYCVRQKCLNKLKLRYHADH